MTNSKYQNLGAEKLVGAVLLGKAVENLVFQGRFDAVVPAVALTSWLALLPLIFGASIIVATIASLNLVEIATLEGTAADSPLLSRANVIQNLLIAIACSVYVVSAVYYFTTIENAFCILMGFSILVFEVWRSSKRQIGDDGKATLFVNGHGKLALTVRSRRSDVIKCIVWDAQKRLIAIAYTNGRFEPGEFEVLPEHVRPLDLQPDVLLVHLDRNGHMIREYFVPIVRGDW